MMINTTNFTFQDTMFTPNTQDLEVQQDFAKNKLDKNQNDFNNLTYFLDNASTCEQSAGTEDVKSVTQNEEQNGAQDDLAIVAALETQQKRVCISDLIDGILKTRKVTKQIAKQSAVAVPVLQKNFTNGNCFKNPAKMTNLKNKHWTPEEIIQLYNLMGTFQMDFTTIANQMETKNRKQIVAKYNRDDKRFPQLIDKALNKKLTDEDIYVLVHGSQ